MNYPDCPKRQKISVHDDDGLRREVRQCTEPSAIDFSTFVEPRVCDLCHVRGRLVADASRVVPSPVKQPKVVLAAQNVPCLDRRDTVKIKCCGEIERTSFCSSSLSVWNGRAVTESVCQSCPVRRSAS